ALSKSNGNEVEEIAKQKRDLAEKLETSAERRSKHLLETTGLATADMQDYIDNHPSTENSQQLKVLWERLIELLGQCREQNLLNGSILESSQRSIKQAIAILQGHGQAGELYGRAGKTVSSASAHSLTRA
ncbi:MAG: flagellar protein FlgN, partial [Gammaproteobacteria bacterium]|nr:flagellar protein FlgN [Gammaproteobacteria bacterium]